MVNPDSSKVRFNPSEESSYVSDDEEVRPVTGPQPTNKDFKKVFGKTRKDEKAPDDEDDELVGKKKTPSKVFSEDAGLFAPVGEKPSKDDEENASQGSTSLFDLSKGAAPHAKHEPEVPHAPKSTAPVAAAVESPSDLFKRMSSTKGAPKPFRIEGHPEKEIVAQAGTPAVLREDTKKDKFTTRYTPEQPDLTYVNPLAAAATPTPAIAPIAETKVERPTPVAPAVQELINQLVKTMYTVKTEGKTDTVIILQYPPQFKDVKMVVSAYDTARGQFNLSFENLTQAAQRILDLDENRKALVQALEHKGYGIAMLQTTTTTLANVPPPPDEKGFTPRDRDEERRDNQQGGGGRGRRNQG